MKEKLYSLEPNVYHASTKQDIRQQIFNSNATAIMSDVERAKFLGLPTGCRIREGAKIIAPENLRMLFLMLQVDLKSVKTHQLVWVCTFGAMTVQYSIELARIYKAILVKLNAAKQ